MSNLKEQIFNSAINEALNRLRKEMCAKYKPKKENRFFTNGITYEVSEGRLAPGGGAYYEISSKIPHELNGAKAKEKYFKEVKKIMQEKGKKPQDVKMENIIHSPNINEIKERDYVKCSYLYPEDELYTEKDIDKIVKMVLAKKLTLPDIKGASTLPGRAVIYQMQESMYEGAVRNVTDLIKANEAVMKKHKEISE